MKKQQIFFEHLLTHKLSIAIFLLVGTISAIVYLASFGLLWNRAHLNYKAAVSIAYLLSVLVHFCANRRFAFKNHTTSAAVQIPRYVLMLAINYLITLVIVYICVEMLHFPPYTGIVCAIGTTMSISYSLSRFWIFRAF